MSSGSSNPNHGDGWYNRGYLPHFDSPDVVQFLTWRLADSLPQVLLDKVEDEMTSLPFDPKKREAERRKRLDQLLDRGYGQCWLRRRACAEIMRDALLANDGDRHLVHAWVIMPNHLHLLVQFFEEGGMGELVEEWKGSTARDINALIGRSGPLWQEDFWDRYIRDQDHYNNVVRYITLNPVRAGLVKSPEKWPWWWTPRRR